MRRPLHLSLFALVLAAMAAVGCRAQAPAQPLSLRDQFRAEVIDGRRPCPLDPHPLSQTDVGSVRVEKVRFTPEAGCDAVAAVYRPKGEGKYPAIIVQHFLGGSKDNPALTLLMNALAQRGFLVAAIDGRH